nr:MAG TPA: hypothetical protein [Caudoviricetes sp.]
MSLELEGWFKEKGDIKYHPSLFFYCHTNKFDIMMYHLYESEIQ